MNFDNQCIVIKIGSALLIDEQTRHLKEHWLASLIEDVKHLLDRKCRVVLVSSGSVALGCQILGFQRQQLTLEKKQAAAAVGQIQLCQHYQHFLKTQGLVAAQVLLSLDDSEDRKRFLNARNTLGTLLKLGLVPIVNENDTVATSEIRYGDNDRLAARVAQMVDADTLILLSDIDGLYDADPHVHKDAQYIQDIYELSPDILAMGGDSASNVGSGGMKTKLAAAKIAMSHGTRMFIMAGKPDNPISQYLHFGRGSCFHPVETPLSAKKSWLREHLNPMGTLIIDAGAEKALLAGKSLLAVGIIDSSGSFKKGDVIRIVNQQIQELARGLSNYSFDEVKKIKGLGSAHIATVLGYNGILEVVHCDNLVRV